MKTLYLSSLRGCIGDWVYYPCLMTFRDIAERIKIAKEIHDSEKLSDLIQRQLKKKRGKEISKYLRESEQRFFNSLVVGVYGGTPNWYGLTNLAGEKDISIDTSDIPKEIIESTGILKFSGDEKLFALDGQHRLVGIQDAVNKDKTLEKDELTVIFIAHKTDKAGRQRSRRLFTTLNKHAKPVSKADIIALDEDDTMAIAVRRLITEHDDFKSTRISYNATANIPSKDSQCLTTIITLYDILSELFMRDTKSSERAKLKDELTSTRLSETKLDQYYEQACEYFDLLKKYFPPLKEYWEAQNYEKIVQKYRNKNGGNILFRPYWLENCYSTDCSISRAKLIRRGSQTSLKNSS